MNGHRPAPDVGPGLMVAAHVIVLMAGMALVICLTLIAAAIACRFGGCTPA
jgi:hypothetical protein